MGFIWDHYKYWLKARFTYPKKDYQSLYYEAMAQSMGSRVTQNDFSYKDAEGWQIAKKGEVTEARGEEEELPLGGTIILSVNVTPTLFQQEKTGVLKYLEQTALKVTNSIEKEGLTWINRATRVSNVEGVMKQVSESHNTDVGYSVGNLFHGKYYDKKDDHLYSEKSFAIDVYGIDSGMLKEIGLHLGDIFQQRSVLVHDRDKLRAYLLHIT